MARRLRGTVWPGSMLAVLLFTGFGAWAADGPATKPAFVLSDTFSTLLDDPTAMSIGVVAACDAELRTTLAAQGVHVQWQHEPAKPENPTRLTDAQRQTAQQWATGVWHQIGHGNLPLGLRTELLYALARTAPSGGVRTIAAEVLCFQPFPDRDPQMDPAKLDVPLRLAENAAAAKSALDYAFAGDESSGIQADVAGIAELPRMVEMLITAQIWAMEKPAARDIERLIDGYRTNVRALRRRVPSEAQRRYVDRVDRALAELSASELASRGALRNAIVAQYPLYLEAVNREDREDVNRWGDRPVTTLPGQNLRQTFSSKANVQRLVLKVVGEPRPQKNGVYRVCLWQVAELADGRREVVISEPTVRTASEEFRFTSPK